MDLKGKKVTVLGLARSGVGAANLLSALGADVTVTDTKTEEALQDALNRLSPLIRKVLGGHPEEVFLSADMLVMSPGVPDMPQTAAARSRGIAVIGELEFAWQALQGLAAGPDAAAGSRVPFIAITGSNGKSTTTTLLDLMLKQHGLATILGGNIGRALSEEFMPVITGSAALPDAVVAEVSSFQLEGIASFRPHIAALLNITPDHMDRYASLEQYGQAKARISANQTSGDFLLLNADDTAVMELYQKGGFAGAGSGPEVLFFSRLSEVKGVYAAGDIVYSTVKSSSPIKLMNAGDIRIQGVHNLENAMAAAAMALLAGCSAEAVAAVLKEFPGLEHRLEFVREFEGVNYVNDSKGTNVDAVLKSLEGYSCPVVLIAGGRDKAGDFNALREIVSKKTRAVVLIGEAAGKIGKALDGATELVSAGTLKEAVAACRRLAKPGDTVLLSPACASFDMFRDFEDRGRQFKAIVMGLEG